MGFFSWITQDTDRSINNHYTGRSTFDVYMTDNKGNKWHENNYEGYGVFGGKDYYELLAEMNGLGSDRQAGINLEFNEEGKTFITPNLSENPNWEWVNEQPETCPYQGYFYVDYDEDDEDDYYEEDDL
jgi:hypothetical protein